MIVADGGVAALAMGPRNAAGPRSIVARMSVILRTIRGEISGRDSDNQQAGSWASRVIWNVQPGNILEIR